MVLNHTFGRGKTTGQGKYNRKPPIRKKNLFTHTLNHSVTSQSRVFFPSLRTCEIVPNSFESGSKLQLRSLLDTLLKIMTLAPNRISWFLSVHIPYKAWTHQNCCDYTEVHNVHHIIVHPDLICHSLFSLLTVLANQSSAYHLNYSTTLFHGDLKTHSRSRWSIRQLCLPLPAKNGRLLQSHSTCSPFLETSHRFSGRFKHYTNT